jgi:hypothetical protein
VEWEIVYIEIDKRRIMQRLALNDDLDPCVVVVALGW